MASRRRRQSVPKSAIRKRSNKVGSHFTAQTIQAESNFQRRSLSEDGEALSDSMVVGRCGPLQTNAPSRRPRWYAARTSPNHEKRVREHLVSRNLECFLPVYETVRRWKNGCNMRIEMPLFPGYLFVEIDLVNRIRVLEVPGVLCLVGTGPFPWPLPEGEIEALRAGLHLYRPQPHARLTVGQRVRIKTGPLADLTGILLRQKDGLRVVLSIDMLMQGAAVEVQIDDIELLSGTTNPAAPYPTEPGKWSRPNSLHHSRS
jgi:transcription antitermination factor NusG